MPTEMLYRIIDEPKDSPISQYAVKPFWPWLALALAGSWLGVPWFIFNAIALGSPTRRREIALAVAMPFAQIAVFIGCIVVATMLGYSITKSPTTAGFVMLPFSLLKMVCGYALFIWQSRAAQLHEHFGRELRNGMFVVIAGSFLGDRLLASLPGWIAAGLR